jgi:hypothetical protein
LGLDALRILQTFGGRSDENRWLHARSFRS